MKYCRNCGKELNSDIQYCPNCGASVSEEQSGKNENSYQESNADGSLWESLVEFFKALIEYMKERVYANPYTPTNFYHKTDDCKFIRRVPKEELLIFDSEEAAIQNGRFINRCRECFSKDG